MPRRLLVRPIVMRLLAAVALLATLAAVPFGASADGEIVVPCDAGALASAIAMEQGAGGGTLELSAGCTYTLTSGLPRLQGTVTVNGNGATIARSSAGGTPAFTALTADLSSAVTLNDLTITGGHNTYGGPGGILNYGTMTINRSTITDNHVDYGSGGGILTYSPLTVIDSTISNNSISGQQGGGIAGVGPVTVINSTLSGNSATGDAVPGGAIWVQDRPLVIVNSTITGNTSNEGAVSITSTSLSSGPTATIISSTITNNTTSFAGGGIESGGANVVLANSVLAGNGTTDCAFYGGTFVDRGHNVASDTSCGFTATTSQVFVLADIGLGALVDNGGPNQTQVPGQTSPLVDAIPLADCLDQNGLPLTTDQRGLARPQGTACDIGAVEVDQTPPVITLAPLSSAAATGWFNIASSGTSGVDVVVAASAALDGVASLNCTDSGTTTILDQTFAAPHPTGAGQLVTLGDGVHPIRCTATNGDGASGAGPGSTALPATFKVDQTAPGVTITSPADGVTYQVGQVVDADYSCADAVSGIGANGCVGPVPSGQPLDTSTPGAHSFSVTATDAAGNATSQSVSYSVNGQYVCALYDESAAKKSGSTIPVKLTVCDPATGADLSSPSVNVVAVSITDADGNGYSVANAGKSNSGGVFRYDPSLGTSGGYIFNLKTTGLPSGSYRLQVTVDGAAAANTVGFVIR